MKTVRITVAEFLGSTRSILKVDDKRFGQTVIINGITNTRTRLKNGL